MNKGFSNKVLGKWVEIETDSTDWTLIGNNSKGNPSVSAGEIITERNGDYSLFWDYPLEDIDKSSQFHYEFIDNTGDENSHNIRVLGYKLR